MKYHFNYPTWCPFTSFLFFLTQNVDPLVPEKRRKEKHASHSASQQQIIKRDIWRQLRDIFGGVDPFYGLNVVNHMKVFLLMMTLQSSVTLPQNKATSFSPKMVFFIIVIYIHSWRKPPKDLKAEKEVWDFLHYESVFFLRLFLSLLPSTQISVTFLLLLILSLGWLCWDRVDRKCCLKPFLELKYDHKLYQNIAGAVWPIVARYVTGPRS